MNLTDDQLAQCRKDYDEWCEKEGWTPIDGEDPKWEIWQAAWRPVPTVEQIEEIIIQHTKAYIMMRVGVPTNAVDCTKTAQAIHAAFGGKNE